MVNPVVETPADKFPLIPAAPIDAQAPFLFLGTASKIGANTEMLMVLIITSGWVPSEFLTAVKTVHALDQALMALQSLFREGAGFRESASESTICSQDQSEDSQDLDEVWKVFEHVIAP